MIVNLEVNGNGIKYFKPGDVFMVVGTDGTQLYMIFQGPDIENKITGTLPGHIPVLNLANGQINDIKIDDPRYVNKFIRLPTAKIVL